MKPLHKIDLIFTVNGKTVLSRDVSNKTVQKIADLIILSKDLWPERDHKFKIGEAQ